MDRRLLLGSIGAVGTVALGAYFFETGRPQPSPGKTADKADRPTFVFVGHEL